MAITAVVLGLSGCATTKASPEPAQEIPLLTGSDGAAPAPSEWTVPPSDPLPGPASPPALPSPGALADKVDIEQAVRQVARNSAAAGVVIDRGSGARLASQNADRPFYAGSLVKLIVGVDAILRHPGDGLLRKRIATMVQVSDDEICSELWVSEGGGTAIIGRMRQRMGLRATEPPRNPGQWGDTLLTANDVVRIYDYILGDAPPVVRETILDGMANASPTGSDGFKQHFGIPSATDQPWAIKQAWTNNDRHVSLHSTGLVGAKWRYTVVLLTEHPAGRKYEAAARSVTVAAQAINPLLR
ncbi:hypothetical protein GC106_32340 [Kibdelosporangium sp. 4NS15]|uniref:Beta-lactamase class A n=1 Tax=Kibdelosporangium persicum TaxID=2698649 RepID=A0ABX2F4Y0_9PSEU|nr:hypothetical protein [Kibdelosporangium persicum]